MALAKKRLRDVLVAKDDPFEHAYNNEVGARINTAIENLSPKKRMLAEECYFYGRKLKNQEKLNEIREELQSKLRDLID